MIYFDVVCTTPTHLQSSPNTHTQTITFFHVDINNRLNADTDSGLGRATPPRRAPSPGMGGSSSGSHHSQGLIGRHLPSPSGPGSLPPGLMTKRRVFDDGSSDISSNQSSMMDYSGTYYDDDDDDDGITVLCGKRRFIHISLLCWKHALRE